MSHQYPGWHEGLTFPSFLPCYYSRALASKVTKAVRGKDGGLDGVEALTLTHQDGNMEVACNLLDYLKTPPEMVSIVTNDCNADFISLTIMALPLNPSINQVLALAEAEAKKLGIEIEEAYTIGMTGPEILAEIDRLLEAKQA